MGKMARGEWTRTGAAVVFVAAYAWPVVDPAIGATAYRFCQWLNWICWAGFAVDYVVRLAVASDRRAFVRRNLFDLAVVVLPVVRPLRLLRLVTLIGVLNQRASDALRGRVVGYAAGTAVLTMLCGALAVLDAERQSADANITTFPDALWWAATTVTTVGYGDRYPTTGMGRLIAIGLMVAGIALLGVVTAAVAAWFVERVQDSERKVRGEVEQLSAQVTELQALLSDRPARRPE
jgi:voltage-gated potassium channel